MKKLLLSCAAALTAIAANAEDAKVIATLYDGNGGTFNSWGNDSSIEEVTEDEKVCMKFTNPKEANPWEAQFAYDADYKFDTTYTVAFDVKGTPASDITSGFQCTEGYKGMGDMTPFSITEEWQRVIIYGTTASESAETPKVDRIVFNMGAYVGTLYISDVVIYEGKVENENPGDAETGELVQAWFDGNGGTFGGWGEGATFDNVDEDGKPCLKFTNPEEAESWKVQAGIDRDYEFGVEYTLSFDIKGNPATGLTVGFQDSNDYAGMGNMTSFNVTEQWEHVAIKGVPTSDGADDSVCNRIVLNLGTYVGTFYMTNVKLYKAKTSGVAKVEAPVVPEGIYNMQGIKVSNSSNLEGLAPGMYIVNGKKIIVR